jgi:hypothetical protein
MGRLPGVAGLRDAVPDEPVELGETGPRADMVDGGAVDGEELFEQLVVLLRELAGTDVLRVVAPVAVHADPDLEERRLPLLHGAVARRREGPDPRAGPDEGEPARQLDLPLVARALGVDEALPERSGLALLHAGP